MSDRERYKTRHTVERFFAHIKEHKRLIARFDKLATTFFSFFALACLNVLKHFVNSTIIRSLKPRGVRSKDRRAMNATLIQSAAPVTVKTWEVVEGVSQRPTGCPRNQSCQRIQTPLGRDKGLRATLDTRALWLRDAEICGPHVHVTPANKVEVKELELFYIFLI